MLYRGFWVAAWGTSAASLAFVAVLWPYFSHQVLLGWLALKWSVMAVRVLHAKRFQKISSQEEKASPQLKSWINGFSLGLVTTGGVWGIAAALFLSPENIYVALFVLLFLSGVAATAGMLHTSVPAAIIPFLALVLIPVAIRMSSFEQTGIFIALAVLGYWLLLWAAAKRSHRVLWQSIAVSVENERLQNAVMAEKLAMEQSRRIAAQEYEELFLHMPDGLALVDVTDDGGFRLVSGNPAMERMIGLNAEVARGKRVDELVSASSAARAQENYRRCIEAGKPIRYETVFEGEGIVRHFEAVQVPMRNEAGRIHRLIGIYRDITERKQLEETLALREQEFRTLVENSPEVIVRYSRDLTRIFSNPAFDRMVGAAPGELRGKALGHGWLAQNMSADEFSTVLQRVFDNATSEQFQLEYLDDSGMRNSLIYRLVPEFGRDGSVVSVLGFGHDVSVLRRQEELERARVHILERLSLGAPLGEVLDLVARYLEQANRDFLSSIMLLDEKGERLYIAAAPNLPEKYANGINGVRIGHGVGSCGTAAWSGEEVFVDDIATHPYWARYRDLPLEAGLRACWSFPITERGGKVLGVFGIYQRKPGLPNTPQMESIRQAHHLAVVAIERNRIEEKLRVQASIDTLTGLPNRSHFNQRLREELQRSARSGQGGALLFIDLDRFKEVNDSLGHEYGDELLIEAARRISKAVRATDLVARLGGDEFVIILSEIGNDPAQSARVAQTIVHDLEIPFDLDGHQAFVSASIGIACFPSDASSPDTLLSCADQAMYAAKEMGRNGFCFFTPSMQQSAELRLKLSRDLRGALAGDQLALHFQPIVDAASGRLVKAEGLLRWQHPERGLVPPNLFIPIAEEAGLIGGIGDWIFQQAALTARAWRDKLPDGQGPCQISVNMSPRQFVKEGGESGWLDYLAAIELAPHHIGVEITEGLLLDDRMHVAERLEGFRAAGIEIALDDFGTGYSAMAYLKKYPIDYLKIDRSFVRDLVTDQGDAAIAEATIVMAHKLGLRTVAEGVETAEQRDMLLRFGCDMLQGYYYAKPMPRDEFLAFVERSLAGE
ncbi:EAL domain-containing protein [Azonexus sp. IMCC34839]|uniref:sensor domain-containing protein n=1 Tax=Azonexus sp. IMCC34839 TaxID=3133695 RepID=UPI00399C49B3